MCILSKVRKECEFEMKIIGLEEHWCPRSFFDEEGKPGYKSMASVRSIIQNPEELEIAYNRVSNIGDERIKMMDAVGLSMQILSICNISTEMLPPDEATHYAKLANDILLDGIMQNPERFRGFAVLPTGVPDEAAKELKRCMKTGYFLGAIINGHINGHYLDEEQFEPILEIAEKLNAPLYIHPAVPPKPIIDTYYKMQDQYATTVLSTGGWGWHIETGVHVLRLIASGAFDRHPSLKVIVGHLGEGLPFFMNRLYNATGGTLKKPYPEYLKENIYYTISDFSDADLLEYVIKKVGEDHIMFSSDFPFNPLKPEIDFIKNINIDDEIKEKIAHKNAEKLFNL